MTSLTIVRRIAARPAIVFEAVTTADGIASWWGPDAGPVLIAESDPGSAAGSGFGSGCSTAMSTRPRANIWRSARRSGSP